MADYISNMVVVHKLESSVYTNNDFSLFNLSPYLKQMAIIQLNESKNTEDLTSNVWFTVYKYFATKTSRKCWYIILLSFTFVEIYVADVDIYFHEDQIGPWVIRSCFFFWMFISIILIITARNMRDHFSLMLEMKVCYAFTS